MKEVPTSQDVILMLTSLSLITRNLANRQGSRTPVNATDLKAIYRQLDEVNDLIARLSIDDEAVQPLKAV